MTHQIEALPCTERHLAICRVEASCNDNFALDPGREALSFLPVSFLGSLVSGLVVASATCCMICSNWAIHLRSVRVMFSQVNESQENRTNAQVIDEATRYAPEEKRRIDFSEEGGLHQGVSVMRSDATKLDGRKTM